MGMDIWAKHPANETGRYFRVNVWAWRPIHELISTICADLVDEELLNAMECNSGAGPDDGAICKKMAERFRDWLLTFHEETYFLNSEMENAPEVTVMKLLKERFNAKTLQHSDYSVERETLIKWVNFLEHCGGFAVH